MTTLSSYIVEGHIAYCIYNMTPYNKTQKSN